MLTLQFPSRLQISCVLLHSGKFAGLKEITLGILFRSWKKSIRFVAFVRKVAPLVETLKAGGNLRPLKDLKVRWPKNFAETRLRTIRIEGFSGESEFVVATLVFSVLKTLLIDTGRRGRAKYRGLWRRSNRSEDAVRQERWHRYTWPLMFRPQ
ncbi:uncharacterized protein LOC101784635 [Setaria italica]|nr:uncharacterized protein LOC101784635 [Setaria italica]